MKHVKPYLFEARASEPEHRVDYYDDGGVKAEQWSVGGKLHREDRPAWIEYYESGKLKREVWRLNGARHRVDGPADIWYYESGGVKWEVWWLNDDLHREDGPAWIEYYENGRVKDERWYLNNKRHREDRPADIEYYKNGRVKKERWYLDGVEVSEELFIALNPSTPVETLVRLGQEDPDPEVRQAARRNPNYPDDVEGWAVNLDDWS